MKITRSKEVYRCALYKTGFRIQRCVVRHVGSVVMMAVDDKKRILLVRQYRLPADKKMWEPPAGRVDEGERLISLEGPPRVISDTIQ